MLLQPISEGQAVTSLLRRMTSRLRVLIWPAAALLLLGGVVALAATALDALVPSPPPAPNPHEFARELSGLNIPTTATVDTLRWEPSGRFLWARVGLSLSPAEMAQLVAEARSRGYRDVVGAPRREERHPDSVDSFGMSLHGAWEAAEELPMGRPGLYRYERSTDPLRYVLAVLDSARGRFVADIHMP